MLAGGQSLIPMLNLRLARFEHLVDIGRIPELHGIERTNGHVAVGAMTRDVGRSSVTRRSPATCRCWPPATPYIGHFQIRNRGTIGGSLAHADPAAEYPAVALALDATFRVVGVGGDRSIPAAEFFTGVWSTAMEPDELLVGIDFPVWSGRTGVGVAEFARRHGDFAIAGAVVAVGPRRRQGRPRRDRRVRCGRRPGAGARGRGAVVGQRDRLRSTPTTSGRPRSARSTTSPTTPRCRRPTAGGSAWRWSPRRGTRAARRRVVRDGGLSQDEVND